MLHSKRVWIIVTASLLLILLLSACASYPQVKAPEPTNTPLPAAPTEPAATATVPIPTAAPATAVPPTEAPASAPSSGAAGDAQAGATVYASSCAACHGQKGEGAIGPTLQNLSLGADEIATIIRDGKAGTAMPPFGSTLGDQDIQNLAAFVLTLGK